MTLKTFARTVADWAIPTAVLQTARTSYRRWKNNQHQDLLGLNKTLHNRHQGERCFILATGPSITKQNLKPLANELCIGVSNFFVHPDYDLIRPRYHCIPAYHPPITPEAWKAWLQEINTRTGQAEIFFDSKDEHFLAASPFEDRLIRYVRTGRTLSDKPMLKSIDLTRTILAPQSVTITALQIALYMGCKDIYLLGTDHNWILNLNVSTHFYEENQHALNRNGYNEWFDTDLEADFWDYINLWKQYKFIKSISGESQIFNATSGGLLDVFPRVEFEKLFSTPSRADK